MKRKRLCVIGFDSADVRLLRTWSNEGHLPHFRRLMNKSLRGTVRNPKAFEAGAVWPNFVTGMPVDFHGQFEGPFTYDPLTYKRKMVTLQDIPYPPFWEDLDAAGKRVVVVDVPYVVRNPELRGIQVSDWMTHVRTQPEWLLTTPFSLSEEIASKYGRNPFESTHPCPTDAERPDTPEMLAAFREKLVERTKAKTAFIRDQLEREDWEFFISVFHELHDMGHMAWHVHDETHEFHDRDLRASVGDPLLDIYIAADRALGELLESIPADSDILLYCSHGIGPERTGSPLIGKILKELEKSYLGRTRFWLRRESAKIAGKLRNAFIGNEPVDNVRFRLFFQLNPNNATGGVRFNLKGRDKYGRLDSGGDFAVLSRRLKEDLKEIMNMESGEPLIEEVFLTDDLYHGPKRDTLPDMCLEWNKSAPIRVVSSPKIGTLRAPETRTRVGDHVFKTGMFFASGAGIKAGELDAAVDAEDFAPTILRAFDCPTDRFRGKAIRGLFA